MEQPALLRIIRTDNLYRFRLDLSDGPPGQEHTTELTTELRERLRRALQMAAQSFQNLSQADHKRPPIKTGAVNDAKSAAAKARDAYMKVNETLQQDESRYNIMQKAYQDSLANPKNVGSFDAALLAFHMGMTVGAVKGMRQGRDLIMMHKQARSLPETMQVAVEHWVNGAELSPEQRENFLKLAQDKMETSRMQANEAGNNYQTAFGEYRSFVKDVGKGKVKMPTKGPGVAPTSPEDEANEYLNSLGKH